jgi:predicted AlkP superfamily pyrophosphatase or phosphodiesterase
LTLCGGDRFDGGWMKIRVLLALLIVIPIAMAPVFAQPARGRIVIVMVWDGLRPDSVTVRDTPNLFEMAHHGTRFDRHHSMYPTLTMVNAAALATGANPGANGIVGNVMYLAPVLSDRAVALEASGFKDKLQKPFVTESTASLVSLNGEDAFAGHLEGLDTVAQELEREGGYLAIAGKAGPTFLWDDRVASVKDGLDSLQSPHKNYLFAADDFTRPQPISPEIKVPPGNAEGVADSARDDYFTRVVTDRAIPQAKLASDAGHPALIVLWQHNPDLTQHYSGLGTLQAIEALSTSDLNLAKIRAAIVSSDVADRTDVVVVSDHGFATIRMTIDLNALLTTAGLKKALDSDDVVVARNGGTDLIYLSKKAFPTESSQREQLQKIVNFAEAQEWCGPIFSRNLAPIETAEKNRKKRQSEKTYLGWIDGTFAQDDIGILNPARSPDLAISFREISDQDNKGLTGPEAPAFSLAAKGQNSVKNGSKPLVHPVKGILYADGAAGFTTGMGMHGAAGRCEIHNFCAGFGPDFKRGFVDTNPTGNTDVAPTITRILHLQPNVGPGGIHSTGRVMTEALAGEREWVGSAKPISLSTKLTLTGVEVTTTLHITRLGDHDYLDDATEARNPLGSSP